jgi:LPS export ABC transporter protein LptC
MIGLVLAVFVGMKLQEVKRSQPVGLDEANSNEARVTLTGFDYSDVKEGRTRWTLRAAEARYFDDTQKTVLSQVNATFFLKDGRQVELQSDEGVLHNETKNMEVSGNVRLSSTDGYRLETDRLDYDHHTDMLHTAAPVLLEGRGLTLKGLGMEFEIGNRSLSILKNIETKLKGMLPFGPNR